MTIAFSDDDFKLSPSSASGLEWLVFKRKEKKFELQDYARLDLDWNIKILGCWVSLCNSASQKHLLH
ncbi:hypothetical protein LINGRAPRIM_LOCUS3379 [Linum grandiflorum]